jgi:hypothetical protein
VAAWQAWVSGVVFSISVVGIFKGLPRVRHDCVGVLSDQSLLLAWNWLSDYLDGHAYLREYRER